MTVHAPGAQRKSCGINYAGFLKAGFGLGEAARGYVEALSRRGYDVLQIDADELLPGRTAGGARLINLSVRNNRSLHPLNIVHINPDLLNTFRTQAGAGFFRNRYTIGIWAWETSVFPLKWYDRFNLVDEIWVGGSFMARGISMASPVPVLVMPHVVRPAKVKADRERFGLDPGEFTFLFSFDFHSTLSRKNPMALIEAFRRAFDTSQPARLVLKSLNGADCPVEMGALRDAARGLRVTFMDVSLDECDRWALMASCDSFVSLHRAEGFGLGIAEAMAMGKPVIATGWSGNTDFMNVGNSLPVKFRLAPLEQSDPPYEKGSIWAFPDLDDAAEKMRLVFHNRELADEMGSNAAGHMAEFHSHEAIGALLERRLRLISRGGSNSFPRSGKPLRSDLSIACRNRANLAFIKGCGALLRLVPARMGSLRRTLLEARERASSTL